VPGSRAVIVQDRFGGVLRKVDATHTIGRVGTTAVKERAREAGDAACGHDHRITWVVTEVADEIVRLLVANVLDDLTGPGASIGEQVHGAVRLGHVVEWDPAGEVRLMSVG